MPKIGERMLQTIIEAIVTRLTGIEDVVGLPDVWAGDIEQVVSQPKRLPALWVVYQGADFAPRQTIGGTYYTHTLHFTVVLAATNARSRADGAATCHEIIEAVRGLLIGYKVSDYGELWPEKEELIDAAGALLVYGLAYRMEVSI
jgi:phage gp37-like protein